MFIKIIAVIINTLIPGAGLVLRGAFKTALIIQVVLVLPLIFLCITGSIFEPIAISGYLLFASLIHLLSTAYCFSLKPQGEAKPLWFNAIAAGVFIMISSILFIAGFVYKDKWLGVHIYFVPSMSMHPTLKPGEFIFIDTWQYQEADPKLNDVVVFRQKRSGKGDEQWLVKRIANWPGGNLSNREGWYVLGDNSSNSQDSRYFGGIQQDQILGKVKLVLLGINQHHHLQPESYLKPIQ